MLRYYDAPTPVPRKGGVAERPCHPRSASERGAASARRGGLTGVAPPLTRAASESRCGSRYTRPPLPRRTGGHAAHHCLRIKERIAFAATVTAEQADAARKVMAAARAHGHTLVPPGTVMALPTAPCIAARPAGRRARRLPHQHHAAHLHRWPFGPVPPGACPARLSLIGWAGGDEALHAVPMHPSPR
jgi:hypothetical protein